MTLDIERELRTYGEFLSEAAPAISDDEWARTPVSPIAAPRQTAPVVRGLLIAAGVAVILLVAVGALAFLVRMFGDESVVDEVTTTTGVVTTTAAPPPDAAPAPPVIVAASAANATPAVGVVDGPPIVAFENELVVTAVRCGDPTCASTTTILTRPGRLTGLALRPGGAPVLLIRDDTAGTAVLLTCANADCESTNEIVTPGYPISLAVGSEDRAVVVQEEAGVLSVRRCTSPACDTLGPATPLASGDGWGAAVALDGADRPVVIHWTEADGQSGEIHVVRCADPDCTTISSASMLPGVVPSTGAHVVVAGDDLPLIFYNAEAQYHLVQCGEPACSDPTVLRSGTVASSEDPDRFGAFDLGGNGLPLIAYLDSGVLYVVSCEDLVCTDGGTRRALQQNVYGVAAMAIDGAGNPALAYSGEDGVALLRCTDPVCGHAQVASYPPPPPTLPAIDSGSWVQTDPTASGFEQDLEFESVQATPLGIIARSFVCDDNGNCDTRGWMSQDGRSWSEIPLPQGVVTDFVAGGPGLVVLTFVTSADASGTRQTGRSAVWGSSDGVEWTELAEIGTMAGPVEVNSETESEFEGIRVGDLTAGPEGLLIRGFEYNGGWVMWTSDDAVEWSRVPLDLDSFDPGVPGQWYPENLATFASEYLLIGEIVEWEPEWINRISVWASLDAVTWEHVTLPHEQFEHSLLIDSTIWPGGVLLQGAVCDESGDCPDMMWVSGDGRSWQRVTPDPSVFSGSQVLEIFPGGPGLVAVSVVGDHHVEAPLQVAIWTSSDGVTWELIDTSELPTFAHVTFIDGEFVMIGSTAEGPSTSWVWTPEG